MSSYEAFIRFRIRPKCNTLLFFIFQLYSFILLKSWSPLSRYRIRQNYRAFEPENTCWYQVKRRTCQLFPKPFRTTLYAHRVEHVPCGEWRSSGLRTDLEYSLRVELVVVTELVEGVLVAVGLLVYHLGFDIRVDSWSVHIYCISGNSFGNEVAELSLVTPNAWYWYVQPTPFAVFIRLSTVKIEGSQHRSNDIWAENLPPIPIYPTMIGQSCYCYWWDDVASLQVSEGIGPVSVVVSKVGVPNSLSHWRFCRCCGTGTFNAASIAFRISSGTRHRWALQGRRDFGNNSALPSPRKVGWCSSGNDDSTDPEGPFSIELLLALVRKISRPKKERKINRMTTNSIHRRTAVNRVHNGREQGTKKKKAFLVGMRACGHSKNQEPLGNRQSVYT